MMCQTERRVAFIFLRRWDYMTAQETRTELARLMKSRKGLNDYTQARPCYFWGKPEGTNPGKSDCSGSCRDVYLRTSGFDIGGNTSAQVDNAKRGRNGAKIIQTPTGTQFDESKLRFGDLLYFRGNTAHTDDVGHVEMYTGPNECTGHGDGKGPTVKNLKTYCAGRTGNRRALYAVRLIHDDAAQQPTEQPAQQPIQSQPQPQPGKLGNRALVVGCKGADVEELQQLLIGLKHNLGAFGPKKDGLDGDYGNKTASAVKAEQKLVGLTQTGNADLATIDAIRARAGGQMTPQPMQRVRIQGGNCHIRVGPGTNYGSVGTARNNTVFEASGQYKAGWNGIVYMGKARWVSEKYSEIIGGSQERLTPDKDQAMEPVPPAQPSQSAQPTQPTQPTQSTQSTQPTQPTQPTQSAQTTQPSHSGDATKPILCVDLSQHNGLRDARNDWAMIARNVEFLILRCGVTRTQTAPIGIGIDADFERAAKMCRQHGIPFGVYYYGKVATEAEGRKEADKCWDTASPFDPLFYVYDVEEDRITDAVIRAWADQIRKRGAKNVGLYIAHHFYKKHQATVPAFDFICIPRYGKNDGTYDPKYAPAYPCDLHQYTSIGRLPGFADKNVDINRLTGTKPLSWFLAQ